MSVPRRAEQGIRRSVRCRRARLLLLAVAALGSLALPTGALAAAPGPTLRWSVSNNTTLSGALSVAVAGNDAFTTAYWPGQLTAVDISNPSVAPTVGGSTPATTSLENGTNVTVAPGSPYAFVVSKNRNASGSSNDDGSGNSMTVVDISNPANPTVVGSKHDAGKLFGGYGVAVSGHYAYVAYQGTLGGQPALPDTSSGGFSVIDITNPAGPTIVANIDNGSLPGSWAGSNALQHATSVAVSGSYAYVTAFYSARVTVIDISNPMAPAIVASLNSSASLPWPVDAAIQGNRLYVANQTNGFQPELTVLDISNPAQPAILGTLSNGSVLNNAYRIRVRGNFAYLAAKNASTIAAVDVSDPTKPRLAGAVQDSAHLFDTTGLDLDPSGRYVIASSPELSTEGSLNPTPYPPFANTTGTISMIDLIPNPIGVTIVPMSEPPSPTTQTSANFSFSTTDTVSTVACKLDGGAYGACTTPTTQAYSALSTGSHTFTVQTTDAAGTTATDSYTWTITPPGPTSTSPPTISGPAAPAQGDVLTVNNGSWTNNPTTYTHQWEDCTASGTGCTAIASATGQTYTLTAADAGHTIVVQEWASNGGPSAGPANSAPTAVVSAPPASSTPPSVTGTPAEGQTLTATTGSWTGYPAPSYAYQWQDCPSGGGACSPIASATGHTYTAQATDVGSSVQALVTATNSAGSASAHSAPTAPVTGIPASLSAPTISGAAAFKSTLTESHGSWSGSPTSYAVQWEDCNASGAGCVTIAGATGQTHSLGAADVGHTIRVLESARNSIGTGGPAVSPATPVVALAPVTINVAEVRALLNRVLSPHGRQAQIPALLKAGAYAFSFPAPQAGRLSLTWYFVPKGASLARLRAKPTLMASASVSFAGARSASVTVRLTPAGRRLLVRAKQLTLTAKASFTVAGNPPITVTPRRFTLRRRH